MRLHVLESSVFIRCYVVRVNQWALVMNERDNGKRENVLRKLLRTSDRCLQRLVKWKLMKEGIRVIRREICDVTVISLISLHLLKILTSIRGLGSCDADMVRVPIPDSSREVNAFLRRTSGPSACSSPAADKTQPSDRTKQSPRGEGRGGAVVESVAAVPFAVRGPCMRLDGKQSKTIAFGRTVLVQHS